MTLSHRSLPAALAILIALALAPLVIVLVRLLRRRRHGPGGRFARDAGV